MNAATIQTASVLFAIVTGLASVWLTVRAQARDRVERLEDAERRHRAELDAVRKEGRAEKERELRPEINLLRSERDDARRERDECQRRISGLEDELRRRNGGK